MFEVKTGVARPAPAQAQRNSQDKYPTSKLAVDQYFIVPKSQQKPDETPQKFRNRINQAVRTYKQRVNTQAPLNPDYDEKTYKGPEYSIILLGEPDKAAGQDWEAGDIGVWRDA